MKIISKNLALTQYEICKNLYSESGMSKVFDYTNKTKTHFYDMCKGCETSTPHNAFHYNEKIQVNCLVCGTVRSVKRYKIAKPNGTFYCDYVTQKGKCYVKFELEDGRINTVLVCETYNENAVEIKETKKSYFITI
jgi:hypothetical protein